VNSKKALYKGGCNFFFGADGQRKAGYSGYIPREGIPMNTQETDPVVENAIAEFARRMREKAAEFRATHAEQKLTISAIERLWGESRLISDDILKRLYTELTNTGGEQELIDKKKEN
jgi:hypothetical protein